MTITILTLFPAMFAGPFSESILKRAQEHQVVTINIIDLRAFTTDKHHTTDLPPYGGGPGMVMMIEPIDRALQSLPQRRDARRRIVLLSAKGARYTQPHARRYSQLDELVLICGHYEGVDERVREHLVDEEVRIGDYVLTGGELPAMVVSDSVVRLLPGAIGDATSTEDESHSAAGVLEYPQYTRPKRYNDWEVPEILLSGDHTAIASWRDSKRLATTTVDGTSHSDEVHEE